MRFKDFGFKDFIPAVLGNALRRNKGYKKYKKYPHTKKRPQTGALSGLGRSG